MTKTRAFALLIALLAIVFGASPLAHEIPRDVTVHTFLKPEGERLRVLIRVPLAVLRDIQFPERDGFLDVARAEPDILEGIARWILPPLAIEADGVRLGRPLVAGTRVSLPSDRSFASYEAAVAHVTGTPDLDLKIPWNQAALDILVEYRIPSEQARLSIQPGFERLGVAVLTVVRLVTRDGVRGFEFHGDPGLVRLDPRWHQAALHFVRLGFVHILDGTDHLLFLACLVIPFRRLRPLVLVVTAFTAAHSLTLMASALGIAPDGLWFPPLIETLIAASIVYLALENILRDTSATARWLMAFGFGLVHGFGFSFALRETLQFAGSHLLVSLLAFNVGVEIGQVLVLLALVPALNFLFRHVVSERMGVIVLSAIVAHTAWHWMTERWDALKQFAPPSVDTVWLLGAVRILLLVTVAIAATWWVNTRMRRSPRGESYEHKA